MYSVVDIAGVNRDLGADHGERRRGDRRAWSKATVPPLEEKPLVAATMFGVTTPCVTRARERLEELGYEVLVFHATGAGGQSMEALVRGGFIAGVLDVTTTELADELVGGVLSAGPDRLEAAGAAGLPQVVSLGALDMVNFGPREIGAGAVRGPEPLRPQPDGHADADHRRTSAASSDGGSAASWARRAGRRRCSSRCRRLDDRRRGPAVPRCGGRRGAARGPARDARPSRSRCTSSTLDDQRPALRATRWRTGCTS